MVDPQFPSRGYVLDFLISRSEGGPAIGIECDGREHHERRYDEDRERDTHLLREARLERIYRFPGSAIYASAEACLYVVSLVDGWVFTDKSRLNLETLGTPRLRPDATRDEELPKRTGRWRSAGRCCAGCLTIACLMIARRNGSRR